MHNPFVHPDHCDRIRHDIMSPLTAIHARAQLLSRAVQRSPSLTDEEEARLLAGLAAIESTVVSVVDTIYGPQDLHHRPKV